MKLKELVEKLNVLEVKGDCERDITGVQIDSRLVGAGNLFVAVRGTAADGHNFIGKALAAGAVAVLCEENVYWSGMRMFSEDSIASVDSFVARKPTELEAAQACTKAREIVEKAVETAMEKE